MIQAASTFGFKIYYGEGTRLDILHASGAATARAIMVCVDNREVATRIARLVRKEFPLAHLYVRAYDRGHALDLIQVGVDYQIRETFESAMVFGAAVLRGLDVPADEIDEIVADVRRRDEERFQLQIAAGDVTVGNNLILGNAPRPTPLTTPKRPGQVIGDVPAIADASGES